MNPAVMDLVTTSAPRPGPAATTMPGFKDWAVVCAALMGGRQSIILRKGGIAEGRDGFRFKHENFYLFPTQYHQQMEKVRDEERSALQVPPLPPEGTVCIHASFHMDWALWIDDWSVLTRLDPFHIYREETVRERFDYGDEKGLQVAFGRVYLLQPAWSFPDKPGYGGCRSWVQLPEFPPQTVLQPALGDDLHRKVGGALRVALGDLSGQMPAEAQP